MKMMKFKKKFFSVARKKNQSIINKFIWTCEVNSLATVSDLEKMVLVEFGTTVCSSTVRN